eukprot:SAG22_NODE_443_length_10453_cov_8.799691_9_plen_46_part_00
MEVFWHTLFYMTPIVMKLIHDLHTEARKFRPKWASFFDKTRGGTI